MQSWRCGIAALVLVGACSFDEGGIGPDDGGAQGPDAPTIDASTSPPDARRADARPADARPPDAAPDANLPDGDGDGVPDVTDNCAATFNPGQEDEDGEGVGDLCDNCPTVSNPAQPDTLEEANGNLADGVGDACDPRTTLGGDSVLFFDGFNGNALSGAWTTGGGAWSMTGGVLQQTDQSVAVALAYWNGGTPTRARAVTSMVIDAIVPPIDGNDMDRYAGLLGHFDDPTARGYLCVEHADPNDVANTTALLLYEFAGGSGSTHAYNLVTWDMTVGEQLNVLLTVKDTVNRQICTLQRILGGSNTGLGNDTTFTSGNLGILTAGLAATFRYFIVYGLGT